MTNTAEWVGEREKGEIAGRERERARERQKERDTHDDRQKRADQTERPNCVREKKNQLNLCSTVSCELRGEIK